MILFAFFLISYLPFSFELSHASCFTVRFIVIHSSLIWLCSNSSNDIPIEVLRQREAKWLEMLNSWDKWMAKKHKKVCLFNCKIDLAHTIVGQLEPAVFRMISILCAYRITFAISSVMLKSWNYPLNPAVKPEILLSGWYCWLPSPQGLSLMTAAPGLFIRLLE